MGHQKLPRHLVAVVEGEQETGWEEVRIVL